MSWNSKVIWSEGMLLQPQHLQQHDRYLQAQLEARVCTLSPYDWGFSSLRIDETQLALGKISLLACEAVLPDGTTAFLPSNDELPVPLDVPADARNLLVVLALPSRRPGIAEVSNAISEDNYARYKTAETETWDSNGLESSALMQIGRLRLRVATQSDVANGYTSIGIARIIERCADGAVVLDDQYWPTCMDFRAAPRLSSFTDELLGLLHQRGDMLGKRLAQPGVAGTADIADFLLLQLINRVEPLFAHYAGMTGLHPEQLYRAMVQLAGELATFTQPGKRAVQYPVYRHDQLAESFRPVLLDLRAALSLVADANVVRIPLEERQYGIRIGVIPDQELVKSSQFILAVNADIPAEAIRNGFPPQVKIGSIEKIRDLVNLQLPGIGLRALPVAPRQLPFHAGYTYFELDRGSESWKPLANSAGFAMHVAGDFPGLQMQFWAIRRRAS